MYKQRYPALCVLGIFSVAVAARASNITFACPGGWDMIGTHCYNFVNIPMDFEDARDVCDKYGARLLVIRDEVEAKDVSSVALTKFKTGESFWVYNGRYEQDSGKGSLNSTFCKGMWQPNEPRETSENVSIASNMQGRWALSWVWSNLPFVCRTPACPTGSFRCSDGTCLNMRWTCDGAYDCKDLSDENNCSDGVKYYKNSTGTVDSNSSIAIREFYQWIIEGEPGEVLRIEFETLAIEDHVDNVRVYSGGPSIVTSDLIQDIRTSSTHKLSLFSKNHFVIVTLQLQLHTSNIRHVKFNWKPDSEASWKQVTFINVTNSDRLISSPYYNSSMAPVSFKREWLLRAPEGEVITLEVLDNTLGLNANSDLYIVTNVGFVLKELNSHKAIYISSTNSMSVIIKTRSLKKDFSFNASLRKGCDFVTNLTLATFTMKNLPGNISCSWTMQNEMATNFRLQINETFIANSSDVFQIYNGTMVHILNHSTTGIKEYEPVSGNFSIRYVSDIFHPGMEVSGKISAGCQDFENGKIKLAYSNVSAGELYKAQLSCPKGFRFKQEEYSNNTKLFAVCKEGGIWDWGSPSYTRTPECQIVYCGFPPPIPNGFVSSIDGNITYNSVASYQCFSGFEIIGASNVTCQDDGSWSVIPSCIADNCSDILNVTHGSSNSSDVSEGSVVTFSCDPGYSLQGPRTIACLSNKTWSHNQPECKELTCPLPVIEHGHYDHKSIPKFEESVVLVCDSGYQINRTQSQNDTSIICSFNRTLNENDICVDIDECSNGTANNCTHSEKCVNLVGSYSCVCKSGFNGTNCRDVDECALDVCHQSCTNLEGSYSCSCYEGYMLYTGNGTYGFYIPAGEDGLKPGDVYQINNTCVPVTCNKGPEPPANGTVLTTKSTYYYNESVHIACSFGYILENSSFATCQSDGNWTYSTNPICKNMSCPQPSIGKREDSRVPATGDIEPGASLTITCKLDDESGNVTNKTLFCAPSLDTYGQFVLQGDDPTCPEVNCGIPLNIPGGNFTVSNTTYSSSFEFACDSSKGFSMTGASTLGNTTVVCQSNGRWGFANLTCEGSRCKDPGTVGGTVQIVNTSYEIDQVVQYNCTRPGFTPVTNATLVCEYKNGTAQWSSHPPACEDAEQPVITCPTVDPLDLYSTIVYPHPNVTDNSDIICFMLESGPPSGVSVVSNNTIVRYKATDTWNNNTCEFNVTVKDRTEPTIECPPAIQIDLAGSRNELFNLNESVLISHSGDGIIKFDPKGPLNLTVGSVIPVRVNITKENGLVKECAFLVSAVSTTCSNDSLPQLDHGRIENCTGNTNNMECVGVCDKGYLFQNTSNSTSYSCVNGTWDMDFPVHSCIKLYDPIYDFNVKLLYARNGSKFPILRQYQSADCSERHCIALSEHVKNISACGYDTFIAINCSSNDAGMTIERTSFILQLLTTGRNETSLSNCFDILQNQSVSLFGPTYPVSANMTCLSPWSVQSTLDFEPMNISCSNNSLIVDYNGVEHCLPCGLGTFYNTTIEECQQCLDGYYQDEEGQTVCTMCPHGVLKSHVPRTQESHCFELCPAGFVSISGYIEDNCTVCQENQFSISPNSSQPCPNNGSTLGVSGATSQDQCSDPCSPGEYSITGYKPCSVCPKNFYSINQGERMCTECPSNTSTAGNGSNSTSDCLNSTVSLCIPNFCNPDGTIKNGSCEISGHRPVCQCKPGFYGDSCSKSCDVCNPNPCYNGGTCTASGLDFTCTCKNETCTFIRNQHIQYSRDPNIVTISLEANTCHDLCLNNNNCEAYGVDFINNICYQYNTLLVDAKNYTQESYEKYCSGQQLFNGSLCEIDLKNECNNSACASIDFCMDLVEGTKCNCPYDGGNYDNRCAKLDDPCQGNNCSLHGKCITNGSVRAVCECDPGYTGERCETDINECEINSHGCLYNGSCQDGVNTYSCSCVNGSSGSHCEVLEDFCHHNNCQVDHGGICTNDYQNFTASCTCGEHYRRDSQKPDACARIDYCLSNPCVNGTCTDVIGGFTCNCTTGFEGSHCQRNIDDCVNHSCQNGATCVDGVSNYTCTCPAGFTGSFCEENIDDCSGKCVVNNTETKCQDLLEDYYCPCKPAYTGKNCSDAVDMCTVYEPCLHGGNCSDFSGGYNCTCAAGWTGDNCDHEINYCSSNSCQNNGVCYNLVDRHFCKCSDGTAGINCQHITENLCDKFNDSVCSSNGKCELIGGTIRCQCLGEYSGKACEFEKDYCADDPCNGGICTLSNLTYVCDCSNVKNYVGKNCNETKTVCSTCPNSTRCQEFQDQDGYLKPACMCRTNETLVGNTCKTVDRDYDLAFLESFANKGTFLTSESGFYLNKSTDLSITMWVAAAKQLDKDQFILALRSSKMNYPFLSVFNTRVQFSTNINISVELTDDIGNKHSLDEPFTWHLIGISWSTNGNLEIWFDFLLLNQTKLSASPPSEEFVFVHLGQSFYGYISQVSIWKTALTPVDHYEMFDNKLAVPQPDSLLLGWTQYSFDSSVRRTKNSTAAGSFSICNITDTIALMECKNRHFLDKTQPEVNYCNESMLLPTDYSKHQVSSSELGYTFTDDTDRNLSSEGQLFSYGAYDIAVSAEDLVGNIGVCMTRAYITPNRCSDTEPSEGYNDVTCSANSNGKRLTCPPGMLPSVPTPNFVSCSNLMTYNLDDLYEKPDRIVCGVRKPLSVTVNMVLPYRISVNCDDQVILSISKHIQSEIKTLNTSWRGLCSDKNCSNVKPSGYCTGSGSLEVHIKISGLNETLSSPGQPPMTPLEIMTISVAGKDTFNFPKVADTQLENKTQMDETSLCDNGYSTSGIYCVQCGPGSYYDEGEKKCKLCELNTYSDLPDNISCTACPQNKTTLQRGSSNITDCKEKCNPGEMLNLTTNICEACPKNFYQDKEGKSYCFPCLPATGTENNGSKSQAECIVYCPEGEEDINGTCVSCPDDHYKQSPGIGLCLNCTGDFTSTQSNRSHCTEMFCDVGHELKAGNCSDCDHGYYKSSRGNDSCIQCPLNKTTALKASTSDLDCSLIICPVGSYRNESTNTCFLCARGTYQNVTGKNNCESCMINYTTHSKGSNDSSQCYELCPQGNYRNGTYHCVPCPVGQYQNESDQTSCKPCGEISGYNASTVSTQTTNERNCFPICPEGFYLDNGTRSCRPCSVGTYKSKKNLDTSCKSCKTNFTTLSENETNSDACILDKCKRGYYRDANSTECKLCPVGEYQSFDELLNVTACTQCPAGLTTLLEGAPTQDGYCIMNCSKGEEYHLTFKNCSACPLGMYRSEGAREPPTCFFCPSGSTTLNTGESSCIKNPESTLPAGKIDLVVIATLSVQACSNAQVVINGTEKVVLQLIRNQNNRYNRLCDNNCTSNSSKLQIKIDDFCGSPRSKRQIDGKATVNVTVKQIDAVVKRMDGRPRPSMAALMEAFYDLYPVEDLLKLYQISFDSVKGMECGQACVVSSFHYPQICIPGQFVGADTCEPCAKGSYSTDPVSKICKLCPEGQTTALNGARNQSSCDGVCATNTNYCGEKGNCAVNSDGKSFCDCQSEYSGYACSQRKAAEDSNVKIIVGVTVGVGGFLLILLIIFGVIAYRRQADSKSTSTSVVSESDVLDYRFPMFNPTTNWNDPPLYRGETIDLHDNKPSVHLTKNGRFEIASVERRFEPVSPSHFQNSIDNWD